MPVASKSLRQRIAWSLVTNKNRLIHRMRQVREYWRVLRRKLVNFFATTWPAWILVVYFLVVWKPASHLLNQTQQLSEIKNTELRDLLLALGAIIGTPFLVWRSWIAWKQVDIAQQAQITSLFTKAVEQLGAERERKTQASDAETVPTLEIRVGAILALDRIASNSRNDYWRVMEVLAAYVRNNATANGQHTNLESAELGINNSGSFVKSETQAREIVDALSGPRVDIQSCIDVIGRRSRKGRQDDVEHRRRINLSGCDLRKVQFAHWFNDEVGAAPACFDNVDFSGSLLDGADFTSADLNGCIFSNCSLTFTNFVDAKLISASFDNCQFHFVNFCLSNLRSANFGRCKGVAPSFNETRLKDTSFVGCHLEGGDFSNIVLVGGGFLGCNLSRASFRNARMKGGVLHLTFLTGADLRGAKFFNMRDVGGSSSDTDFSDVKKDDETMLP